MTGYIRTAAATPELKPADINFNTAQIESLILEAARQGCNLLVFPKMCITGATCGDLLFQETLLARAKDALLELADVTHSIVEPAQSAAETAPMAVVVSLPMRINGHVKVTPAVLQSGRIILPPEKCCEFAIELSPFKSPVSRAYQEIANGAYIIVGTDAAPETAGGYAYRRNMVKAESARLICGYVYANAAEGESSTDHVYSGHSIIAECGKILAEGRPYTHGLVIADIDIEKIAYRRNRTPNFFANAAGVAGSYGAHGAAAAELGGVIPAHITMQPLLPVKPPLMRPVSLTPFVPSDPHELAARCEEVLQMQAAGLARRLAHTESKIILGLSGGLDSTLALLAALRCADRLKLPRTDIMAYSMPGLGTSERTANNAKILADETGISFAEISITKAILQHFEDIGHPPDLLDTTYENAQARERTQILMDLANRHQGIMLGTGDLSEAALGFTTYGGDHMSMYNVNGGVPKTLIPFILEHCAKEANRFADQSADRSASKLAAVLRAIIKQPISPELLPAPAEPAEPGQQTQPGGASTKNQQEITQITEDIVGPYLLNDFFMYHILANGATPEKIIALAELAADGRYTNAEITEWLQKFYRRFFAAGFKRNCAPDSPAVGSVSLSPRNFRMPSDAAVKIWL